MPRGKWMPYLREGQVTNAQNSTLTWGFVVLLCPAFVNGTLHVAVRAASRRVLCHLWGEPLSPSNGWPARRLQRGFAPLFLGGWV